MWRGNVLWPVRPGRTGRPVPRRRALARPACYASLTTARRSRKLIDGRSLTRAQLSELTGVSKVTVAQMLARLEERGLVVAVGSQNGGRGPNAALYSVVPSSAYVAALYVEHGLVAVAIADVTGRVIAEAREDQRRAGTGRAGALGGRQGVPPRRGLGQHAERVRDRQPGHRRPGDRRPQAVVQPAGPGTRACSPGCAGRCTRTC